MTQLRKGSVEIGVDYTIAVKFTVALFKIYGLLMHWINHALSRCNLDLFKYLINTNKIHVEMYTFISHNICKTSK